MIFLNEMAFSYKDDKNIYKNPLKLIKGAMRNTSIVYSASENVHVALGNGALFSMFAEGVA